jgi:nucleoside-diphosphate-sugar epimerase
LALLSFGAENRVIVFGANGWFGRTAIDLLESAGFSSLYLGTKNSSIQVGRHKVSIEKFDIERAKKFEPTVIFDFAFLTREKVARFGPDVYRALNKELSRNAIELLKIDTVGHLISTSSGAAVYPVDARAAGYLSNPYGFLKREFEVELAELSSALAKSITVPRVWSVSGAFVTRPRDYAFSDLIYQALFEGDIKVSSASPVLRRYSSISDVLSICLAINDDRRGFNLFDTGGTLVSLEQLAHLIQKLVAPGKEVIASINDYAKADKYYSDDNDWQRLCKELSYNPQDLKTQILEVADNLRKRSQN